jgi:prepilin-type N-terminal cleavage/methylation domain-containing protein
MRSTPRSRRGFSMIELMISVGVIVLIASISLPFLMSARRTANKTRVKGDLQAIANAIDVYNHDFRDIPRFADPLDDQATLTAGTAGGGTWLDYADDRGARLLCFALVSPGNAGTAQAANPGEDGYNGGGFVAAGHRNLSGGIVVGRHWGPYLPSDKFKIEYDTTGQLPVFSDGKLLDVNGYPILYYPALPGPVRLTAGTGSGASSVYVTTVDPKNTSSSGGKPLYNSYDNTGDTTPVPPYPTQPKNSQNEWPLLSETEMQTLLNADSSGAVISGMTAVYTGPYILWTAGQSGKFGRDSSGKTDNVTNFDFPGQVVK